MRLSEILGCDVLDVGGEDVGRVHDVRIVREGPPQGMFGASYEIAGLVVGGAALGSRLGFDRASVRGPWPLTIFFRRLQRSRRYVEWAAVGSIEGGVVRLTVPEEACRPVPPLPAY